MHQSNWRAVSVLKLLIPLCLVIVSAHATDSPDMAAARHANADHSRAPANIPRTSLDLTVPPLWRVMSHGQLLAAMGSTSDDVVEVVAEPALVPMSTEVQAPLGIVDSLRWSAGHPTQAWRILLPAADAP
jgi:hypothetical protein